MTDTGEICGTFAKLHFIINSFFLKWKDHDEANQIHLAQQPFFDTSQLRLAKHRTEGNRQTQMTLPWPRLRNCQQSKVQRIFEPEVASGLLFLMFINGPILCKILCSYFESIYISWLPQHPVTVT